MSTTLNDTLQFFDAETLVQTQPPLPSRGGGPVRLWAGTLRMPMHVTSVGGGIGDYVDRPLLLAANHGVASGSLGIFDLSGDEVVEFPTSPFPTREPGSVAVTAGYGDFHVAPERIPLILVTNTTHALGGCDMPAGSVTVFNADTLLELGVPAPGGNFRLSGAQPWGVSFDDKFTMHAALNCSGTLESITLTPPNGLVNPDTGGLFFAEESRQSRPTGAGPDATLFDPVRRRSYTVAIDGGQLAVHGDGSAGPLTVVPLRRGDGASAGPIDASLVATRSGKAWIVTANGHDDSVSIVDRDRIEACIAAGAASCAAAELARIATGVPGGEPEGVAYDPASNRIFVVNKPLFAPSLSVLQLTESPNGGVTGAPVGAPIPLGALGTAAPVPALIAFDVVVQER